MNISIDNNDILKAAQRGVELLRSDVSIPAAWKTELVCLDMLLQNIIDGRFECKPVESLQSISVEPKKVDDEPKKKN